MDEELKRKLRNRYRAYAPGRIRHPDARGHGKYERITDPNSHKKADAQLIRRRPNTVREIRLGWEGLVAFMDFFQGDRKLAAESCSVSRGTINRMCKLGYVTPYVAICAQDIETMPFTAAGLCRYLEYDWQWNIANDEFKDDKQMRHMLKNRTQKKLQWVKAPAR